MILTRTPLRISFFGGGTDYPDHFRTHGGQTLGVAIDKYSYVLVNRLAPIFDYGIRVSYSKMEICAAADQVQHPAVREACRFLGVEREIEVHYVGDLPARSGLGSSSSFTVGLLHALHGLRGGHSSQRELAEQAVHVEREMIGERVGVQDQFTCAHGGLLHLEFLRGDAPVRVHRVPLPSPRMQALETSLMLFYTGIQRHAHAVLDEQLARTRDGSITTDLDRMASFVDQGREVLTGDGDLRAFGELLHDGWQLKRGLSSKISNAAIDDAYARARAAGAVGGKLLGAGGGGFLLLFVPPDARDSVVAALHDLKHVPLGFDQLGTTMLFYQR
jgi:D-glycero-alpha-D-manno-heptose-7-phosphate kinase